jgi:hypothetical protein
MNNDPQKFAEVLVGLLDGRINTKRQELESLSMPTLDRSEQNNYRKFQTEVEYWQLKNTVAEIRTLAMLHGISLPPTNDGDAVKNQHVADQPSRNDSPSASQ